MLHALVQFLSSIAVTVHNHPPPSPPSWYTVHANCTAPVQTAHCTSANCTCPVQTKWNSTVFWLLSQLSWIHITISLLYRPCMFKLRVSLSVLWTIEQVLHSSFGEKRSWLYLKKLPVQSHSFIIIIWVQKFGDIWRGMHKHPLLHHWPMHAHREETIVYTAYTYAQCL